MSGGTTRGATHAVVRVDEASLPGADPQAKVQRALALLGGLGGIVSPGDSVLLKPNFVAPFPQATTSLEVLEAMLRMVRDAGGQPFIAESAGFEFDTSGTWRLLGAGAWSRKLDVPLINLDEAPVERVPVRIGARRGVVLEVARCAMEADIVINLPKLKRHNYTRATLGLKNLMGLLSRDSRRSLHILGLDQGIAALAEAIRPRLTVLDALSTNTRAVYGRSEPLGAIVASRDMVALDHYGCRMLGLAPDGIAHWRMALARGLGSAEYPVLGDDPPLASPDSYASGWGGAAYRLLFRAMYVLDAPYSRLLKGRSLIPPAHFWLGLRPGLRRDACDGCGACARVCAVDAIDVDRKTISPGRCMRLRCLRCIDACPRGAIVLRGLRRPRRR